MNQLKKRGIRLVFAAAFVTVLASCTSIRVAEVTSRVRVIRNQGDMNALIATTSEYTRLTTGKKVDGTMYSCTSFGTKVGGGLGTAIAGWMLAASGYVQNAVTQSQSCVNMLYVMYLWLPMIFNLIITFILIRLNVEKANKELQKQTK